ncbi:MAG TPA: hypothetical protein VMU16_12160 [Candidatus Binataceae bacterium]|nr:hypothetical protein [Candidatus Binataceae bacterium]
MNPLKLAGTAALAIALAAIASSRAIAAEARPWLCRDKPVFSSDRGMSYQVSAKSGERWRIYFMEFTPYAAHDGFEIVNESAIPGTGHLNSGRYYAVAMYRKGDRWICPGYAHDDSERAARGDTKVCFGSSGPPCRVDLNVTPDAQLPKGAGSH